MPKRRPRSAGSGTALLIPAHLDAARRIVADALTWHGGRIAMQESVAAPPRPRVATTEAGAVEAPKTGRPGRLLVQLIRAGWSLNGNYYPAEVLQRDGPAAWPAGTQNFIDHATDQEDEARPAGSLLRLASVQTQAAYWDPGRNALMAEVRLYPQWRETLTAMAADIGMSIRAWVYGEPGEAEGRQGFIVTGIPEGRSVDYVTVPAAGGAIVSVLESAQPAAEARNAGHWFESRIHSSFSEVADRMFGEGFLTREERITLSSAVGDALTAFAGRLEADAPHLYERDPYDEPASPSDQTPVASGEAAPTATPISEHVPSGESPPASATSEGKPTVTTPVVTAPNTGPAPGTPPTPTPTAEAPNAPATEAPDARASVLEAERDSYRTRATSLSEQLAEAQADARTARATAGEAVTEMRRLRANEAGRITVDRLLAAAESGVPDELRALISPRVHATVRDHVPLTDAGEVDQPALEAATTAAIRAERVHAAQLLEAQGVGRVAGLGADGDPQMQMSAEALERELADVFRGIGLSADAANLAAKGR